MENWLLLNKLIILIYVSSRLIEGEMKASRSTTEVVFFLLFFIILNIAKAMVDRKTYKYMFLFLSIIDLLFCYLFVNPIFLFFIPINICEILLEKLKWLYAVLILLMSSFLVKESNISEYIVISLFSLIASGFALRVESRIKRLTVTCDELKEKNYKLLTDLSNEIEYKNQIIYTSQLEERNKIAQEIHDKLGHSISGSLMQLEAANLIIDKDIIKGKNIIQNTINVLREGMESIRGTLKNIKPEPEQLGINKIKLLIDEFNNNDESTVKLYYSDELEKITFWQWKIIYENIKETLTNVRKYSKAKNVKIDINVLNKLIKIEIKDDGKGCEKVIKGLGLSGIEERTLNLNGKVIVDGSDGFSVIILLPINEK